MANFANIIVNYLNELLSENAADYDGMNTDLFQVEFKTEDGYTVRINAWGYFAMSCEDGYVHFDNLYADIEKDGETINDCYELPQSIVEEYNKRFEDWAEAGRKELEEEAYDDWCKYETESSLMSWGRM